MNSVLPAKDSDVLLLVEGEDDKHFVYHLINKRELNLNLPEENIISTDGVNNLLQRLYADVQPSRKILGIMVDADKNCNKRWKEIIDILSEKGVSTPKTPTRSGTIIPPENDLPKIGIWIMPDNRSKGELEDFVLEMIPENDEIMPIARKYIREIPENRQEFAHHKRTKSELFAWLANARKPGRIGASIGAGKFNADSSNSDVFVEWLKQLLD